MSPVVRIPDAIFERLKTHATPFEDTPASVVGRLLDFYERHASKEPQPKKRTTATEEKQNIFDPLLPPDLLCTKVLGARFGERNANNWNKLVHEAHREAVGQPAFIFLGLDLQKPWDRNRIGGIESHRRDGELCSLLCDTLQESGKRPESGCDLNNTVEKFRREICLIFPYYRMQIRVNTNSFEFPFVS